VGVIFVGQAPGRTVSTEALGRDSFSGRRLRKIIGPRLEKRAEFVNVLNEYPGHSGDDRGGDRWPVAKARESVTKLIPDLRGKVVVLLGSHVATAFRVKTEFFEWSSHPEGFETVVIPHPSGVNRWWNVPRNVRLVKKFVILLRRVVG